MQHLFQRISICVILIVLNEISDSFCKTVSLGVLQAVKNKEYELMHDFNDLPQLMEKSRYWQRLTTNISMNFNFRHCPCSLKSVVINTLDLWFDTWWNGSMGLDFVLTGDCLPGCEQSSFFGFWRTPTLVEGCLSEIFSNREDFPFMIRLIGSWRKMAQPFYEFMKNFGWRKVAIISSYRDMINTGALEMGSFFREQGMKTYYYNVDDYYSFTLPNNLTRMKRVAMLAKRKTGILLLMLTQHDRMQFLQIAKDLQMLNGKYAFLTVYNLENSSKEAIELQEGLILTQVMDTREDPSLDLRILDGIQLYLRAKNKSDDAEEIMSLMRNDSFNGSSGLVMFDADGIRLDRYGLVNIRNGRPVDVMHLSYDTLSRRLKVDYLNKTGMVWPGGGSHAPNDTIPYKRKTPVIPHYQFILIVLGFVVTVLLLFFAYREYRYRKLLKASEKWIIDWKDLKFEGPNNMYDDAESLTSERISNIDENKTKTRPSEFSYIDAEYENSPVLVQTLLCSSINLKSRKILKEMDMTMSLSHENIVRFLGICPYEPNVAIVMSVGKRGSLQDIIMSSTSGALTLNFFVSLLIDAAKGMEYLHSTKLGSHGHLTSARCVIDYRWTCMISGCGFRRLKRCREKPISESQQDDFYFRELLWTAPEILRKTPERRPMYGTKEGDAYSFAIICQEAVYSDIPFVKESNLMQFKDIVKEVKKKSSTPFRPSMADADCSREFLDLISSCWHEVPSKRPSFHKIILELEKLSESSGDAHTELIEKLMIRTEKHALNLADQVEEATAELINEKKKADDLLQALLPGYVAKILESGRTFEPQEYDSISMCFTDIVEFTKIAAASTPMQVVQLLGSLYSKYDDFTDAHSAYKKPSAIAMSWRAESRCAME